eukprot:6202377-Amphidinium_carterae.1
MPFQSHPPDPKPKEMPQIETPSTNSKTAQSPKPETIQSANKMCQKCVRHQRPWFSWSERMLKPR